jgi:DNA-binding beta-propeller fold protein YncE
VSISGEPVATAADSLVIGGELGRRRSRRPRSERALIRGVPRSRPTASTPTSPTTRGTLTAIDLANLRVTSTIHVGAGAHHLCFDLKDQMAWVALGESARNLVLLSTRDLDHPRVIGHFPPSLPVHDLACSPEGPRVWLTSASGPDVTVVDGLEQVDANTGRILAKAKTPYGSFELAADGRYVVNSSLLRGTLAVYTPQLKLLRVVHLAPATREVALSSPAGSPP